MKFSKRFHFKNMFVTLLITYIIMFILPTILAITLSQKAQNMAEQNCVEASYNNLSQCETVFEEYIDYLDYLSAQLIFDNGYKKMIPIEKPLPGSITVNNVIEFNNKLKDKMADLKYGGGAYTVIMKNNEIVFSNQGVVYGLDHFFESRKIYDQCTKEDYYSYVFGSLQRTLIPSQLVSVSSARVRTLIYNYPIVSQMDRKKTITGVVQYLIPESYISKTFQGAIQEEGTVHIFGNTGIKLVTVGVGAMLQDTDVEKMVGDSGSYYINVGTKDEQIVVYKKSISGDFTYSVSIPEKTMLADAREIKTTALCMLVLCMLVECFLGIYFARQYSKPLRNLINNMHLFLQGGEATKAKPWNNRMNEYVFLEKEIAQLIETNRVMQTSLQDKLIREKNLLIYGLLEGNYSDEAAIQSRIEELGVSLQAAYYSVVSFATQDRTDAIWKTMREKEYSNVILCHIFDSEYIFALFLSNEECDGEYKKMLKMIQASIEEIMGKELMVGVGRQYTKVTDITLSYHQSQYAAVMQSEKRSNGILQYEMISRKKNMIYYPLELENKLVNCTKHCDKQQIEEVFNRIRMENLDRRQLSKSMYKVLISNIVATLIKLQDDIITPESPDWLISQWNTFQNIENILKTLETQFYNICDSVVESRTEKTVSSKHMLLEYMEQNYQNSQLCLSMAAYSFGLSESYFSQYFKDTTGESFSAFLENLRMTKAKELIEHSSTDLEQVSIAVGYSNSGTFRRAFKRLNGVAPSIWKEETKKI